MNFCRTVAFFLALILTLGVVSGHFLDTKRRITNSAKANPNQFPWHVYIELEEEYACGGALISAEWVISSAHCIFQERSWEIYIGLLDLNETPQYLLKPVLQIRHLSHDVNKETYDVGLFKLPEKVKFSDSVQPIQLMPNDCIGTDLTITGFGTLDPAERRSTNHLMYADLKVATSQECEKLYIHQRLYEDIQVCATSKNEDQPAVGCFNDYGAPVVASIDDEFYLVGVFSYSSNDCLEPTIMVRVSAFLDFIQNETGVEAGHKTSPKILACES